MADIIYNICKLFNDKSLVIRWSPGITTEEAQLCELFWPGFAQLVVFGLTKAARIYCRIFCGWGFHFVLHFRHQAWPQISSKKSPKIIQKIPLFKNFSIWKGPLLLKSDQVWDASVSNVEIYQSWVIFCKTFPIHIHSGVGMSDVCKEAKVDFLLSQS